MSNTKFSYLLRALMAAGLACGAMAAQAAVDVAAAEAALKDNKCTKCHSVDKDKSGPSYKKTAEKYKGKADAEAKLVTHMTTGPKIKVDGEEEVHVKTKGDEAAIKNLAQYILSR
ncbi:MAG: class I cytochrome c [Betaproteobacteria bacterium HGW-Betaproteobacteria-18]|nr:MAG: class I cytochrome c [Betaproteobacteria bacterium HGW-Betaproteobacteria-18]